MTKSSITDKSHNAQLTVQITVLPG